jgi:probable rRNA maturation factor
MNTLIQFFSEDIDFKLANEQEVLDLILNLIKQEGLAAGVINYIFCKDDYLLDLNQRFLERDTLTDVIAFDYSEEDGEVSGDVFISIERARENATQFEQTEIHEVLRVIIHGVLHLCGYDDKTNEQKLQMTTREDYYLSLLPH